MKRISSQDLLWKLRRAAQVRALVTMFAALPIYVIIILLSQFIGQAAAILLLFAAFLGISALMTHFYCERAVICPHCGSSLWHCGTGNFKARKMKIRPDAEGCRQCPAKLT